MQLSKHAHTLSRNKPWSVHAHRTEGVTRSKERERANGVGGGIGLGSAILLENAVGGDNGDVNSDGSGDGSGNGARTGTRTGREREQEREWRPVKEHRIKTVTGTRMETRAVADI